MCFPDNHEDPELQGETKGIKAVLMEWKSIWDEFVSNCKACSIMKPPRKCGSCTKSQVQKDAERRVAKVEDAEQQEEISPMGEQTFIDPRIETQSAAVNEWCCIYWVLSLQEDFLSEKPLIQSVIENAGHICLFLPQFHCELNAIEMLWGYAKCRASIFCISCVWQTYLHW